VTTALGNILLADDEETFRLSTAYLLREKGFGCDCAADGHEALRLLRENEYDLLVADIKMPGNDDLQLVRQMQTRADGVPVILVTGYPSVETATESVPLPVVAYLKKPVNFDELCRNVETVMSRSRTTRLAQRAVAQLGASVEELREALHGQDEKPQDSARQHVAAVLDSALPALALGLHELHRLQVSLVGNTAAGGLCRIVNCSRQEALEAAVHDSIATIERTKHSFKSKELGELRRRLKDVLTADRAGR